MALIETKSQLYVALLEALGKCGEQVAVSRHPA